MLTHRILAYLVGLALGYWVLTLAGKEKGKNQTIGKVVGWIILVVSLMGGLCLGGSALYCGTHRDSCPYGMGCPMEKGGWMHGHDMGGRMGMDDSAPADKDVPSKK